MMGEGMDAVYLLAAAAGGTGGFGGAFAAIKVHIQYINKHQERQDEAIAKAEAKAELAHERINQLQVHV